jgi:aspartate/methionine/tyrosine aminotransferase
VDHDPETLLVVNGVAKSHSMTGFRVGWLRAHQDIIACASKLQEPFISCGVPFAQVTPL